jgi:putative oxidoreductase
MSAIARKGPVVARVLLGLVFTIFGLNFFLGFLPQPPPPSGQAGVFLAGLIASGFIMPVIKVVEVGAGLLLLGNRQVPLALTLLAPIVVGIVGYHASLDPAGLPVALGVLALELYLAWSYRAAFAPMLVARAPAASR